ncbi:MAG: GNAT family N-acetyltransferase [Propionibacteriaceae bacterium]|jgi:GNAT superfamily N-acetyltransferase|nr:GNAT family N-acetyltransferase [Propionibacteriaceae bacterium]
MAPHPRIRPIEPGDTTAQFDCGQPDLNSYLSRRAWHNHTHGVSRCYVAASADQVVSFYALAAGDVARRGLPGSMRLNMPEAIPAIVLTRLAIDLAWQGRGLGSGLLKDALVRAEAASGVIAARVLVVHAIDATARDFYRHFDFQPFGDDALHLFTPLHPDS